MPALLPTLDDAVALGLTEDEYRLVCDKLGRAPNEVELAMFSLMWSEHCAYKHSKKLLRTLPTEGPRVVLGPGENAGAVDVGDGLAVAFKVESHNHPSAVEPFQGAATGVGGILRDVFAVGARPIAVLDSLRFGDPSSERSRYLLDHAVAGIGHYGNSIGVATVGGEVYFEAPYETNCLVNAMCVGLIERERLIRSAAAGVGNRLILFGALTGRDGIGGASVLASAELGEGDEGKRPSVQIGDPFAEKKLMECSLELLDRDLLVSLQDLGAAGLTSSASEMASKGSVGIDLDVARVPLREADMEPFEIMVSESQERMLCVCEPSKLDEVVAVTDKWEVHGTAIGEVTDTGLMRIFRGSELVGEMPVAALVDDCPLYDLEPAKPGAPGCVPRARRADRRRQRLALQRGRRRPDLPDAGRRHGRSLARRLGGRAPRLRSRGRRGRARGSVPALARRERAGEAARASAARRPRSGRRRQGPRRAGRDPRGRPRACAVERARHRRGRPPGRGRRVLSRRRDRRVAGPRRHRRRAALALRRGPGRLRRLGPARR